MVKSLVMLTMMFLIGAKVTSGWDEPAGFRDIPWGAPPATVKRALPDFSCSTTCSGHLMIGEIRVFTLIGFETGGMNLVTLLFPANSFNKMKAIFIERYGQPLLHHNETVQNRMGAQFENEILEWNGQKVVILLKNIA